MVDRHTYRVLRGSRKRPPAVPRIGAAPPFERVHVTVHLRPAQPLAPEVRQLARQPIGGRAHLSRERLVREFGARADDISAVRRFARINGLDIVRVDRAARTVHLSGRVEALEQAFDVELGLHAGRRAVFRGRRGPIRLPEWLAPSVVAVLGLDNRPAVRAHIRFGRQQAGQFRPLAGPAEAFSPPELSQLYQFPVGVDGAGQCVAILEFGGGFTPSDLHRYFTQLGLTPPTVVAVSVDGATNAPTGKPNSADGEVMLDIEVVGAVAPGAKIAVYFSPNTDRGFADAILAAVHDQTNKPNIISISWGLAEESWTKQARDAVNQAFEAAAAAGITVFAASGDDGSSDNFPGRAAHVDFPASSPLVIGCGGTSLQAAGGQITNEVVWNNRGGGATGGGVSKIFGVPPYQRTSNPVSANPAHKTGRGVPDVAGVGDPKTGYKVLVDGTSIVIGGTSAVAPLWAGLTALLQQSLGTSVAPLLSTLYSVAPNGFRDITHGNNGAYKARRGWDGCTGLGSPNGQALLAALGGGPSANPPVVLPTSGPPGSGRRSDGPSGEPSGGPSASPSGPRRGARRGAARKRGPRQRRRARRKGGGRRG
jgi:kumamolisin